MIGPTAFRRDAVRAALVAVLVLMAAACGGEDDGLDAADAPPPQDVVALMREAGEADTISATVIDWRDRKRRERAARRVPVRSGWTAYVPRFGVDPFPPDPCDRTDAPTRSRTRLLIDRPGRVVSDARSGDGRRSALARDGRRQEILTDDVFLTSTLPPDPPGVPVDAGSASALLQPAQIADALDLRVLGVQRMATGPAAVLRGEVRGGPDAPLPPVGGVGEDELRLWVDLDTGVAVQVEALLDGEPFLRTTIEDLVLDDPIPAERFSLDPPAGVRRLADADLIARPAALGRAAAEVPFTLFSGAGIRTVELAPAGLAAPGPVVRLYTSDGRAMLEQRRSAPSDRCALARSPRLGRGDLEVAVGLDAPDWSQVLAIREGTAVTAQGRASAEALADLVASLEPVRR